MKDSNAAADNKAETKAAEEPTDRFYGNDPIFQYWLNLS